ncbi:MAG: RDD family protein [Saccharofermentanales bacterium]
MFETVYSIKRIAAYAIDMVIVYLAGMGLNLAVSAMFTAENAVAAESAETGMSVFTLTLIPIAGMVVSYGIPILLFGSLSGLLGWTPGKLICFLRVREASGDKPGILKGILRELIKYIGTTFMFLGAIWAIYGIVTKQKTFYDDWIGLDVEDIKPSGLTETQKNWRKTFRK